MVLDMKGIGVLIFLLVIALLSSLSASYSQALPPTTREIIIREREEGKCLTDEDCRGIVCPQVVGMDTPRCIEGKCVCGPTPSLALPSCFEYEQEIRRVLREVEMGKTDEEQLRRIRERYRECVPQPQLTIRTEIQEVISKYQAEKRNLTAATVEAIKSLNEMKAQLVLASNLTGKELAEKVREINEERKKIIKSYVESVRELNFARREELKKIIEDIKVGKEVEVEGEKVNVDKIVIKVNDKEVEIKPGDNVTIEVEGLVVKAKIPLRVREEKLEDAETNKVINVTPERLRERLRERIREAMLERKGDMLVYDINAEKVGKILGVIPVNLQIKYQISAENGEVISLSKPWWSIFVLG